MVLPFPISLVPLPVSVLPEPGALVLSTASRILPDADSTGAAAILAAAIEERTGLRLAVGSEDPQAGDIVLRRTGTGPAEGYALRIGDRVEIAGNDGAGLFYAVQTLRQLLVEDDGSWALPRAEIVDAPRYAYRGVMLDVARTFFPVGDVKSFIDRAASLKFNRLHLHLSDDQGWRLQIDSRPLLTERASGTSVLGRPGGFYTHDDFREIIRYAESRCMIVVPEIDLPGHTHAVGIAYPEIAEAPVVNDVLAQQSEELGQPLPVAGRPYQGWGVGFSSVKIHDESTYGFLRDVLGEIAELSPGPYLHIGGDEALGTPPADFALFIERATALVTELGKTPIAWHEAGAADAAPGTIGQYWGSTIPQGAHAEEARHFAERQGGLILSPSDTAYLDLKYDADFPIGLTWAGIVDLETAYRWEPEDVVPGLDPAAILGVEAPLWTETVATLADAEQLFFPRAAAIAEIAWSARQDEARDWDSFRGRIGSVGAVWDAAGWGGHRPAEIDWNLR